MFKKFITYSLLLIAFSTFSLAQNKLGIQVNGGAFLPSGDMGDLYNTGFGGTAGLTYDISESIQLSLSSGYMTFAFNDSYISDNFPQVNDVSIDAPFSIVPLTVGAKYLFSNGSFRPYANLNLGVQFVSIKAGQITINGQTQNIGKEASSTETGWGVGVGFLFAAGKNLNVDLNVGFNGTSTEFSQSLSTSTSTTTTTSSSSSTGTWISILAGVQFGL